MVNGEDVVERPVVRAMPQGTYWHVHATAHDATAGNPHSTGRFARPGGAHAMFYVGDTPAVALWESALRDTQPDCDGLVFVPDEGLAGRSITCLTLLSELQIVDLCPPGRRMVVSTGSHLEPYWEDLYVTADYGATHAASGRLQKQYDRETVRFDGILWPSRQDRSGAATLFFEPPTDPEVWRAWESIELGSARGHDLIAAALDKSGFSFVAGCGV